MNEINRPIEEIKLTTDMILNLMQGKDFTLIINAEDPKRAREFRFRGPFDGVFLTHQEISQIQYDSEMGIMNVLQKLHKNKIYNMNTKKNETCMDCGGHGGVKSGPPCPTCKGQGFIYE